ncbi:MAG: DUF6273 domain-containing protein, partial [Candidatus Coproplasma sp.]
GGLSADHVLENNDWETISKVARAGKAAQFWSIGDKKTITLGSKTFHAQIIGFEHDNVTDAATYGKAKAGITFQLEELYSNNAGNKTFSMNSSATSVGGWASSAMRTSTMATIKNSLPAELKSVVQAVNKVSCVGNNSSNVETVSDVCFLLSEIEIRGSRSYSAPGEGSQYAYYAAGNSKIKYSGTTATGWWTRSARSDDDTLFIYVKYNGAFDNIYANEYYGVAFAFCV